MILSEWVCLDCDRSFSATLDPEQYEEGTLECPRCRSRAVEQLFDDVEAVAHAD
jgi:DNA-directed RNA polymerase subunit RPC12/RpoP